MRLTRLYMCDDGQSNIIWLLDSVFITAMLFALSVPPGIPWWMIALHRLAVLLAKQVFGGLGQILSIRPWLAIYFVAGVSAERLLACFRGRDGSSLRSFG